MSDPRTELEHRFHRAMLSIYDECMKLPAPYRPEEFKRKVAQKGGKHEADRLLSSPNPASGFTELLLRGPSALVLSVEYLVLQEPWRALFEPAQLAVARQRLADVDGPIPPEHMLEAPKDLLLPEELPESSSLPEGAVRRITINSYERNPEARARCIQHHGTSCAICGVDFGQRYGPEASGLIHVHHLTRIADIGSDYLVDPVRDLRPVCPNCHAVIHFGDRCRSLDEVKEMLASQGTLQSKS